MATISGVAVFWGLGSSLAMTFSGSGTYLNQDADFSVEADNVDVPNYAGETVATAFFNDRDTFKLRVIPTGANIAAAEASAELPRPGIPVTIVDTHHDQAAGASGTAYQLMRADARRSNKNVVELMFELRRFRANNVTASVS